MFDSYCLDFVCWMEMTMNIDLIRLLLLKFGVVMIRFGNPNTLSVQLPKALEISLFWFSFSFFQLGNEEGINGKDYGFSI